MKKTYYIIGAIAIIIILILVVVYGMKGKPASEQNQTVIETPKKQVTGESYKDISYKIDDEVVTLKNGVSEETIQGSISAITTSYFGNEAKGDVNGDGKEDVAFLLSQSGGGTGVFVYVVVALKTDTGYKGTNAVILGDRIAPQTTQIKNGKILVNFADRKPDEPMVAEPTVGVTKTFEVKGGELVEI